MFKRANVWFCVFCTSMIVASIGMCWQQWQIGTCKDQDCGFSFAIDGSGLTCGTMCDPLDWHANMHICEVQICTKKPEANVHTATMAAAVTPQLPQTTPSSFSHMTTSAKFAAWSNEKAATAIANKNNGGNNKKDMVPAAATVVVAAAAAAAAAAIAPIDEEEAMYLFFQNREIIMNDFSLITTINFVAFAFFVCYLAIRVWSGRKTQRVAPHVDVALPSGDYNNVTASSAASPSYVSAESASHVCSVSTSSPLSPASSISALMLASSIGSSAQTPPVYGSTGASFPVLSIRPSSAQQLLAASSSSGLSSSHLSSHMRIGNRSNTLATTITTTASARTMFHVSADGGTLFYGTTTSDLTFDAASGLDPTLTSSTTTAPPSVASAPLKTLPASSSASASASASIHALALLFTMFLSGVAYLSCFRVAATMHTRLRGFSTSFVFEYGGSTWLFLCAMTSLFISTIMMLAGLACGSNGGGKLIINSTRRALPSDQFSPSTTNPSGNGEEEEQKQLLLHSQTRDCAPRSSATDPLLSSSPPPSSRSNLSVRHVASSLGSCSSNSDNIAGMPISPASFDHRICYHCTNGVSPLGSEC